MLTTIEIGRRITDARKKGSLSQAELARKLSISPQAVGKWERGESMPDILTFDRLASVLGVDLNYFSDDVQEEAGVRPEQGNTEPANSEGETRARTWNMSKGNWVDADFSGLNNLGSRFGTSNIQNCLFVGSDLSGLLLKSNNVERNDFSGSDLSKSHMQGSNFVGNQFRECTFVDSLFSKSSIQNCDFTGADFTGTSFEACSFQKNELAAAKWESTTFHAMDLTELTFEGEMHDCAFEECSFGKVTFQNVTLYNTFFRNKTHKKIRFVNCKADRLTYAFLKNGKADMSEISLIVPEEEK